MYKMCVVLFIVVFFPKFLGAEEYSLEWGKGTVIHTKEEALNTLFLYAVTEEAVNVLEAPRDSKQYQSIVYFFKNSFLEYIKNYIEIDSLKNSDFSTSSKKMLLVDVFVDKKKIEKELQDIGAFYTRNNPLQYELSGESPISKEELFSLEGIFGLVRVSSSPIKLFFWKEQESKYSGILSWDTWQYSYNNLELRELWIALWSEYWKKKEGVKTHFIIYELEVSGLQNVNDISSLTKLFEEYPLTIYDIKLEKIERIENDYRVIWFFTIKDEASFISIMRKVLLEYSSVSYKVTKQ